MSENKECMPGDWISFWSGGKYVIGQVLKVYVEHVGAIPKWTAATTEGAVSFSSIVEVRAQEGVQ